MHGLNKLINNNVQLQRLDDINNIDNINNNVRHQQQHQQQQNYMLNSISELYNLRLENISPNLTLDW